MLERSTSAEAMQDGVLPAIQKTRVYLVDEHPIVRRGLQLLLRFEPGFTVCGESDHGPGALQQIMQLKPDLVVVELRLRASSGLQLIKDIRAQGLKVRILVFTKREDTLFAERALRAGANGYLSKQESTEKTLEAMRTIARGKSYFSRELAQQLMGNLVGTNASEDFDFRNLSDRELEILDLFGEGMSSRQIASVLMLSYKTIESHRERIKAKLGIRRTTSLVKLAYDMNHSVMPV